MAEKRKSLLDQLAVKYQEETDRHRDQIKSLTTAHDSKVGELNGKVERLKVHDSGLLFQAQVSERASSVIKLNTLVCWNDMNLFQHLLFTCRLDNFFVLRWRKNLICPS